MSESMQEQSNTGDNQHAWMVCCSYEEHLHYLFEIVKLKLWFLWHWMSEHPEDDFSWCLRERVDIYRKTNINDQIASPKVLHFDIPAWQELEDSARKLYESCKMDINSDRFERKAFEIFQDTVKARSRRSYEERPYVLDFKCGSLNYDAPKPDKPGRVFVHIANAVRPRSIFDDPGYIPACLMDLMDRAESEYGATELETETWLNSHPRWVALFPEQWRENMGPEDRDVRWHYAFWGQFITARGTFNEKNGAYLRKTGQFPYWMRRSWCGFDVLRDHLMEYIKWL